MLRKGESRVDKRLAFIGLSLMAAFLLSSPLASAQPGEHVDLITVEGVIDPFTAQYVERGLDIAQRDGAQCLVIQLDTPGGSDVPMRVIVQKVKLDEVTARWGVKVTTVEISEIFPPREVQDAMTHQMAAERSRRAMVLEADGTREAAIKVAEGEKQSAILKAEGDRRASILRAEGFSMSLNRIFKVAKTVDSKTMSLQYLETLKALGASPATKFVFPMEFANLLRPFTRYAESVAEEEDEL